MNIDIACSPCKFENQQQEWVNILCDIAELALINNSEIDLLDIFGSSFYYNSGSKSGSGVGTAYKEDLAKKLLIEDIISKGKCSERLTEYLNRCLLKVNQDIENTIKRDEEFLEW